MTPKLILYEDNINALVSSGKATAWDTETTLIAEGNVVPQLICSSFAPLGGEGMVMGHLDREQHVATLRYMLEECLIVGQNIAFDLSVAARYEPELLPLIWKALDEGRIRDTMIREMLINLTMHGNIDIIENHGINRKVGYGLADLVEHYLNVDIKADKDAEDAARITYHLVMDKPVAEWPERYVTYAADDAKYTGMVFLEQELKRRECVEEIGYDPFVVEQFRVRSAFALRLMEAQGCQLDPDRVLSVTKEFLDLYQDPRLTGPLTEAGLIVPAKPPTPFANGAKNHLPECFFHKDHPEWKKGRKKEPCDCPVKMKKGTKETGPVAPLHNLVWKLALEGKCEAWISDSTKATLKEDGLFDDFIEGQKKVNLEAVNTYYQDLMEEAAIAFTKGEELPPMSPENAALVKSGKYKEIKSPLPGGWKLSVDKEWLANFQYCDKLIELYGERKHVQKIVTSYLPSLYTEDILAPEAETDEQKTDPYYGKIPAPRCHPSFAVLKRTGRTSSFGSKLVPSFNGQQVDPRIRPCVVPAKGRAIFSVDYCGMELCTTAQKCIDLFGYSVMGDKINEGVDLHAFLGAQIANELDPVLREAIQAEYSPEEDRRDTAYRIFQATKGVEVECWSDTFQQVFKDSHPDANHLPTWGDFFKHYRKFAKPTGLGYPGGLGAGTFVVYAKATYGVTVNLDTAKMLRKIWIDTYPEMKQYLDYVNKECWDRNHAPDMVAEDDGSFKKRTWYAYDTPMGMHRAKCDYCSCANGQAMQAISAEGALLALQEVLKETSIGTLKGKVFPMLFIHDEIVGEVVLDGNEHEYIAMIQNIMEDWFMKITPAVTSRSEAALMERWDKYADPVYDDEGKLAMWYPKQEEEK